MLERTRRMGVVHLVGMMAILGACAQAWGQTGACCIPGPPDRCEDGLSQLECSNDNGTYQGDGTDCTTVTCPQYGACCDDDGVCTFVTQADCTAAGGTYQGDVTTCATVDCLVFGACCVKGQCTDSVEQNDCWFGAPDGGCFYQDTLCSSIACSEVEIVFSPNDALLQQDDVFQLGLVVRSTTGFNEQIGVVQINLSWDETQLELVPPAVENSGAYDWLTFGLPAGGVGGPLNADFTDGDAYLEATPQVDLGNQPVATPAGLLMGWVEFKAVGATAQSQITIPIEVQVPGSGATVETIVLDTDCPPVAGLNILGNVGVFTARTDCNANGVDDTLDISGGTSSDCNQNTTPDECEIDVNSTAPGGPWYCTHDCDPDCNENGVPDGCDIDPTDPDGNGQVSEDCQNAGAGNGIPDECENDCNCNSIDDACDLDCGAAGGPCDVPGCGGSVDSLDCGTGGSPISNGVPDECDVATDCNENSQPDVCDITPPPDGFGSSTDSNSNGIPDECEGPAKCGDVNADTAVNLFDIFCLLSCIEGSPSSSCGNPGCQFTDLQPCGGDGVRNLFDVFAILEGVACAGSGDPQCCCDPP